MKAAVFCTNCSLRSVILYLCMQRPIQIHSDVQTCVER